MLRFGLPAGYWPLFLLPVIVAVLTVALAVLVIRAWMRRHGSLLGRVFLTLATLAAITVTGLAAYWGLLTALF